MKYKTDNGGFSANCDDIKIFCNASTWSTRLSQLAKCPGKLIIMTYGFGVYSNDYFTERIDDEDSYIRRILDKRPRDIFIICNSASIESASIIKRLYPQIRIRHNKNIHSRIALLEPRTVMFAGEDFGYSTYCNFGVGFHSEKIYAQISEKLRYFWKNSEEIT